jgi:phenylpropionate dioxygenase-like ring-hydroxylating dioxygenase large terminal subunit
MSGAMANPDIARFTRDGVRHGLANSFELAPEIRRIDAARYVSEERFAAEMTRLFRRLPLLLAPSCEITAPGDFKTMDVAGVPILLVRGNDGTARAFVNACSHRGANVATEPCGNRRRFTCPYHGWTYDETGRLVAIAAASDFGDIDRTQLGLTPLPAAERAGLIFGILDPASKLDIDGFLAGYDTMLEAFGLKHWHFFSSRTCEGPNWKISFDGYLDYYHLPVLHKNSFGRNAQLGNRALYRAWGPHQRLVAPDRAAAALGHLPESEWPDRFALIGVWTIFPGVAIASFDGGGRGVMISHVLPGEQAGHSRTRLIYLMERPPSGEQEAAAVTQFDFLQRVVIDEDYATGLRQQQALKSGALKHVLFGRNESGQAVFHDWVDRILATDDADLNALFRTSNALPA